MTAGLHFCLRSYRRKKKKLRITTPKNMKLFAFPLVVAFSLVSGASTAIVKRAVSNSAHTHGIYYAFISVL